MTPLARENEPDRCKHYRVVISGHYTQRLRCTQPAHPLIHVCTFEAAHTPAPTDTSLYPVAKPKGGRSPWLEGQDG